MNYNQHVFERIQREHIYRNESVYACVHVCMYAGMPVCTHARTDGCIDVWMYGCMDGWMDGWIYGCMEVCVEHDYIMRSGSGVMSARNPRCGTAIWCFVAARSFRIVS